MTETSGQLLAVNEDMSEMMAKHVNEVMVKEMTSETIGYRKDSFSDRFCDDLTEVILNYLTLEDKLRLNCVSNQFKRCLQTVLNRQTVLKVDLQLRTDLNVFNNLLIYKKYNLYKVCVKSLAKVLQTMPNIREIYFGNYRMKYKNQVLSTILDNCLHLDSISFNFDTNAEVVKSFIENCGKSLRSVEIFGFEGKCLKEMIENCLNLQTIKSHLSVDYFKHCVIVLKRLRKLERIYVMNDKIVFFDHFLSIIPNITHLDIEFGDYNRQPINDCIRKLSQLSALVVLKIEIMYSFDAKELKCFKSFVNLKKLCFVCKQSVNGLSIDFLQYCKQLKVLYLSLKALNDNFFNSIQTVVPNLKVLILSDIKPNDCILSSVSKLKALKKVYIFLNENNNYCDCVTDLGIKSLVDNCVDLDTVSISEQCHFTEHLYRLLLEKSIKYPKKQYYYRLQTNDRTIDFKTIFNSYSNSFVNITIDWDYPECDDLQTFNHLFLY